jgi:hypothetical protein
MMEDKHAKEVAVLRQYIKEELFRKNDIVVMSLEETKKLQYKEHLRQMRPVIYKEQE